MLQYCAVKGKMQFSREGVAFVLSQNFNRDEIDFILDFHRGAFCERIEWRKNKLFVVWKKNRHQNIDFYSKRISFFFPLSLCEYKLNLDSLRVDVRTEAEVGMDLKPFIYQTFARMPSTNTMDHGFDSHVRFSIL